MKNPDSAGPDFGMTGKVMGEYVVDGTTYLIPGTVGEVGHCASALITAPAEAMSGGATVAFPPSGTLIYIGDPNPDCVRNGGTLGVTMLMMILFSLCVQMAEGLHFGIVPCISRPALGVVSGMVGAGGNTGALLSIKYIVGAKNLDEGFIRLGFVILIGSLSMLFIFFPGEGGIILPKSFPYNPQLIKEAEGQKGSDQLDFSKTS